MAAFVSPAAVSYYTNRVCGNCSCGTGECARFPSSASNSLPTTFTISASGTTANLAVVRRPPAPIASWIPARGRASTMVSYWSTYPRPPRARPQAGQPIASRHPAALRAWDER